MLLILLQDLHSLTRTGCRKELILFFGVLKAHGFRSAARNGSRAERLLTRVGFSLIAGSYPAYYGVPGVESRALLPEGRVPAGRAGGSEEGNHGL